MENDLFLTPKTTLLLVSAIIIVIIGIYFAIQRSKPKIYSPQQALEIAYKTIGEFKNYDKTAPPTVELKDGIYYVTFPLPKERLAESRRSDYAMQIRIEAKSGKVISKLGSY